MWNVAHTLWNSSEIGIELWVFMFVWVAVEETLDFLIILDWLEIEWDYCDEEDKIRVFFFQY